MENESAINKSLASQDHTKNGQRSLQLILNEYKKLLASKLESFGNCHIEVAVIYDKIGHIYYHQSQFDDGLCMYHKSLDLKLIILGNNHLDVAITCDHIGRIYYHQSKYHRALSMFERSLNIKLQLLGNYHDIDIAISYRNIGNVYYDLAKYKDALTTYEKSLHIYSKLLGNQHLDVAILYNNMGNIHYQQCNYQFALSMYQKFQRIALKLLGKDNLLIATSYNNIGSIYFDELKYQKALAMYEKALESRIKILGLHHLDVANSYNNIGNVYFKQNKYNLAIVMYQNCLDITLKLVGANHYDVAVCYNNLGSIFSHQAKYDEALSKYQKALAITVQLFGVHHSLVTTIYDNIAQIYQKQHNYQMVKAIKQISSRIRSKARHQQITYTQSTSKGKKELLTQPEWQTEPADLLIESVSGQERKDRNAHSTGQSWRKFSMTTITEEVAEKEIAFDGYPQVSKICRSGQNQVMTLSQVPGLRLQLNSPSMTDNTLITMTVYYADPPYMHNLLTQYENNHVGYQLIPLSPVVRLEPDYCQLESNGNNPVLLQVPIANTSELCKLLQLDDINQIPIRIVCLNDKGSKCKMEKIKYNYKLDKDGRHCLVFAINHLCDYVVYSYIRSSMQFVSKRLYPTYQQQVKVLAYLSEIHSSKHTTHLKLILARINADERAIADQVQTKFKVTQLAASGLEQVILENGPYQIEFRKMDLECLNQDTAMQIISIDWNQKDYYHLDFDCKFINPHMPWFNIARIFLLPIGQQHGLDMKCCFLSKTGCG
ncbi:Nephrocystin-3 [Trichoplax sp. H2]|nr:Nephrocystin-3 [Trichoplax sp. H2]|eukprot:RDD40932.1 Nephrocystin-3 [Trichoplax sp. H2]